MTPTQHNRLGLLNARIHIWICFFLVVITLVVYWPVRHFDFIHLDDNTYVTDNAMVLKGLSADSIKWAFQIFEKQFYSYWQPLTWLSHMLDVHLYGLNAGNHHLTSLLWHTINVVLLFWVLYKATGMVWRSALVAVCFSVHPLNVESVAWVSERKNVLSTFFWLMTMLQYTAYVKKPSIWRYALTLAVYGLGLMAKPMLVTLPFVLLLMDYWPFGRFNPDSADGGVRSIIDRNRPTVLILEKIPLVLLSLLTTSISYWVLHSYQTVLSVKRVPFPLRLENALVSYVKYITKMVAPRDLGILYPFPTEIPWWQSMGAAVLLAGVSILVVCIKRPYLKFGWLWYLGTLVPVIGLIQAGIWPEMADRWAYVPLVGIFVITVWGGGGYIDMVSERKGRRPYLYVADRAVRGLCTGAGQSLAGQRLPFRAHA